MKKIAIGKVEELIQKAEYNQIVVNTEERTVSKFDKSKEYDMKINKVLTIDDSNSDYTNAKIKEEVKAFLMPLNNMYTSLCPAKKLKALLFVLEDFIDVAECHRNCYFWKPGGNCEQRAKKEFYISSAFSFDNMEYYTSQELRLSRQNAYFHQFIQVNEETKDIRAIKKLINKIEDVLQKRRQKRK